MRDCGCGQRRSARVTTRRYVYQVKGSFCRHEIEALLASLDGVKDVVIREGGFSFQAKRDFAFLEFLRALEDLGIQVIM